MSNLRMTSDLRRQLILSAAKRCFARHGFAGTTTKSVAAAAAISEGLLFKHFPSKSALYAEILAEECEADPDLVHLLGQEPSTATLVELVKGMVGHFLEISAGPDQEEAQRLGRILRPKSDGGQARFYSIVTRDTRDRDFAANRQLFLTEQGYRYEIVDYLPGDGAIVPAGHTGSATVGSDPFITARGRGEYNPGSRVLNRWDRTPG